MAMAHINISVLVCLIALFNYCLTFPWKCDIIVINELNTDTPASRKKGELTEFLELYYECKWGGLGTPDPATLTIDYLFAIEIKSASQRRVFDNPTVQMFIAIEPIKMEKGYYVIGGEKVDPFPNMTWSNPSVLSVTKNKGLKPGQLTLTDMMGNANKFPHAIALLKASGVTKNRLIAKFTHTKLGLGGVVMDPEMIDFLSPLVIDMVVYARRASFERCTIFELLVPKLKDYNNYVMRDIDLYRKSVETDHSINRCTDMLSPFLPQYYKMGQLTPGSDNDCSGPVFILKDFVISARNDPEHLPDTADVQASRDNQNLFAQHGESSGQSCSSSVAPPDYWAVSTVDLVEEEEECSQQAEATGGAGGDLSPDIITIDSPIREGDARKRRLEGDASNLPAKAQRRISTLSKSALDEIESDKYYQDSWRTFIKQHLSAYFDPEWFNKNSNEIKNWLKVTPNEANPLLTTLECRICSPNFDKLNFRLQQKPTFVEPMAITRFGTYPQDRWRKKMGETLKEHIEGKWGRKTLPIHTQVKNHLKEVAKLQTAKETSEVTELVEKESDDGKFKATAITMRCVYTETYYNIPFYQHPNMMRWLKASHAEVGIHHWDRKSATKMLQFFSNKGHKALLKILANPETGPISIITDDATDRSLLHHAVFLFVAVEDTKPVVYFYKLLHLGTSSTAQAHLDALKKSLADDKEQTGVDMLTTMHHRLVGFGSDGASVMFGKTGGFLALLKNEYGKNVLGVHCMAHRLQLAVQHSWRDNDVFGYKTFEKYLKKLISFYRDSPSRMASLRLMAELYEENFYELSVLQSTRWVASDFRVICRIMDDYKSLQSNLQHYASQSQTEKKDIVATAKGLLAKLQDRLFLLYTHFILDALNDLQWLSRKMQDRAAVIVGSKSFVANFLKRIDGWATNIGTRMHSFLNAALCKQNDDAEFVKCRTIDNFLNSEHAMFQNVVLEKGTRAFNYNIKNLRERMAQAMNKQIRKYYPEIDDTETTLATSEIHMSVFDFLDPKQLPNEIAESVNYGHSSISDIVNYFQLEEKFPVAKTIQEWEAFLEKLIERTDFKQRKNNADFVEFWSHYLAGDKNLPLTDAVKYIIKISMVIPVTSAEAERSFSILKHIKYDRRSRLKRENLNAMIRIRMNGPKPEHFRALHYAKLWYKAGNLLSQSAERPPARAALGSTDERTFDEGITYLDENELANKNIPDNSQKIF